MQIVLVVIILFYSIMGFQTSCPTWTKSCIRLESFSNALQHSFKTVV